MSSKDSILASIRRHTGARHEMPEQFFQSLGLSTRLSQEKIGDTTITEIENRFNERNAAFGEAKNVTGSVAREILESCK